jgi:hypothetical protein
MEVSKTQELDQLDRRPIADQRPRAWRTIRRQKDVKKSLRVSWAKVSNPPHDS